MSENEPFRAGGSDNHDYGSTAPTSAAVPNVTFADFSPTEFYNLSENIATNINTINSGLRSLEKMIKQIGGNNDNQLFRDKINNIQQNVNTSVNVTARDIQRLGVVIRRIDKPQKLQVERLTQAFKLALSKYSSVQKQVTEKMHAHLPVPIKKHQLVDVTANDDEAELIANQQAQARLIQFETSMLLDREAQISIVEADVIDVNQIMAELADMVNAQGATIVTVESQIEAAGSNIESGADQLAKAAQHQNRYRRKMLFLLTLAAIIVIVLIIVVVRSIK